jgi:hypothetical protein
MANDILLAEPFNVNVEQRLADYKVANVANRHK